MEKMVSDKNTKAQILEAYDKLLKQVSEKSKDNPKEMQQRRQEVETVQQATGQSEKNILDQIAGIKEAFVFALEDVESQLVGERKKLAVLQQAIHSEEKHLQDLYGLTANADALSAIFLEQKEQKEQFDQEMRNQRDTFAAEMKEKRVQWEKEKSLYTDEQKAAQQQTEKLRRRQEEEYGYTIQQQRKQEQYEYEQKKLHQEEIQGLLNLIDPPDKNTGGQDKRDGKSAARGCR